MTALAERLGRAGRHDLERQGRDRRDPRAGGSDHRRHGLDLRQRAGRRRRRPAVGRLPVHRLVGVVVPEGRDVRDPAHPAHPDRHRPARDRQELPGRGRARRRRPGRRSRTSSRRWDRAAGRRHRETTYFEEIPSRKADWFEQVEIKSGSDADADDDGPRRPRDPGGDARRRDRGDRRGPAAGHGQAALGDPPPRTHLTSGGFSTMGFELPAAIGAQLARPGARSCRYRGDGSFLQSMQELQTAVLAGRRSARSSSTTPAGSASRAARRRSSGGPPGPTSSRPTARRTRPTSRRSGGRSGSTASGRATRRGATRRGARSPPAARRWSTSPSTATSRRRAGQDRLVGRAEPRDHPDQRARCGRGRGRGAAPMTHRRRPPRPRPASDPSAARATRCRAPRSGPCRSSGTTSTSRSSATARTRRRSSTRSRASATRAPSSGSASRKARRFVPRSRQRGLRLAEVYVSLPAPSTGRRLTRATWRSSGCASIGPAAARCSCVALDGSPDRMRAAGRAGDPGTPRPDGRRLGRAARPAPRAGRAPAAGRRMAFHPHAGTYVETPAEVERLVASTDPELVDDLPRRRALHRRRRGPGRDAASATASGSPTSTSRTSTRPSWRGCGPASSPASGDAIRERLFTELGAGVLDLDGVIAALAERDYAGWLMVEQDSSWGPPSESAAIGRRVLARALRPARVGQRGAQA